MKIKIPTLLFLFLGLQIAKGQQVPQYSQYLWNNYLINPAVGGAENYVEGKAGYRDQWVGMEGAPRTMFLTIQGQLGKKLENREDIDVVNRNIDHRPRHGLKKSLNIKPRKFVVPPTKYVRRGHHGIGGQLMNDRIGPFVTTGLYLSYAYHLPITKTLTASLGAYLGAKQYMLNMSQINFGDNTSDNVVNNNANSFGITPDGSLGAMLYSEKFYVGIATDQLMGNRISISNASQELKGKLQRHYFINGGYRIKMSSDVSFVPSTMIRVFPNTPVSIDLNGKINYMDVFWFGFSYRHKDAVVGLLGLSINKRWDIGYSYDFNTSPLTKYNHGTHEIVMGFRIINKKTTGCKPSYVW
jgi:type IX secretion system PorP/SprF family membrane protein